MDGPPRKSSLLRAFKRPVCWIRSHEWKRGYTDGWGTSRWVPKWVCERCSETRTPFRTDLNETETHWKDREGEA